MEVSNASLLDEATAAAEAMTLLHRVSTKKAPAGERALFLVSDRCFPQTIDVLRPRAEPLGIDLAGRPDRSRADRRARVSACCCSTRTKAGSSRTCGPSSTALTRPGVLVAVGADLLSLAIVTPPGEMGADVVFGTSQRFGVPLGFGGPHAAFFATRHAFVRQMPGRIIGVSVDVHERTAYRMALATREQHIRREKATSNICTAQALLANMAAMYAVYHGPDGLRAIASRVHLMAQLVEQSLTLMGLEAAQRALFRHRAHRRARPAWRPCSARRWPRGSTSAIPTIARSTSRSTKRSPPTDVIDIVGVFAGRARPPVAARGSLRAAQRRAGAARRPRPADAAPPHHAVSDASELQHASVGDRDDAVHPVARAQGPRARHVDDSARLLHDEAEPGDGDAADHLGAVQPSASVRAEGAGGRLPADVPRARGRALRDHRLCRGVAAAEFRRAGRVRGSDGHSRVSPRARRREPRCRADSGLGARHQSRERGDGRHARRRRGDRARTATWIWTICARRPPRIAIGWRA